MFKPIEDKWRKQWQEHPIGQTKSTGSGDSYCLDMFLILLGLAYMCHGVLVPLRYYARIKWLPRFNVRIDGMGMLWPSAENDAIKKGHSPANWHCKKYRKL